MYRAPTLVNKSASKDAAPDFLESHLDVVERVLGAGSWMMDFETGQVTCSNRLQALLGIRREVLPNLARLLIHFDLESRSRVKLALQACRAEGKAFDQEARLENQQGLRMTVRVTGEVVRDGKGVAVRMHGLMQDLTEKKRVEQESLSVTMRLSTTLASIAEAFVTLDRTGRFTFLNAESERLLKRRTAELLGTKIWDELDDSGGGRLRRELRAVLQDGTRTEFEEFYPRLGKWLEVRAYPFEDGIAAYLRDVTAVRQSQEQLLLLQTSISRLNDMVLITEASTVDAPGPRIVFVNDAFERHTGYGRDEVLGHSPRFLQGPNTQRDELDRIRAALTEARPVRAELINYKKDGTPFWLELEIVPVDYFSRGLTHWVSVARDITARKEAENAIEHLAFYDTLTQLPNRQLLMDRLRDALSQGNRNTHIGALIFIDLDHFKVLNDTLGHARGDMLLQQVSNRLRMSLGPADTVARLGGDEFVIMLEGLGRNPQTVTEKARKVAEKVLAALSEPYDLSGHQYHGTCSLGITLFSRNQQSIGDLLKQADLAMYQAKAAGRNAVCFFDPEMQAAASADAAMSAQLRQGLRDQEFVLHYQPQVGREGRMIGAEALVRWQHPERGLMVPDDFIPQAEESGLILPLGEWVLEAACAQLAKWALRPETEKLSISVNVSARQFRHPEFVDMLLGVLRTHRIAPHRLKLELTESLLATGMEVTIAKMGKLKDAGVTLAIDDFGMGYSALSYLKYLPLDQLKIDRNFVKDVLTDPNDAAIARTIIGLAQSLGLGVMAEGVETEEQRAFLAWHGCESYQGYLFCRTLPIDELEQFMKTLPP
jgi:diguanylate cyclase (GGDEF)-like protein/PAS domain S-box-containing protein